MADSEQLDQDAVEDYVLFIQKKIDFWTHQLQLVQRLRKYVDEPPKKKKKPKMQGLRIQQVFVDEAQHMPKPPMTEHEEEQERRKYFP